MRNKYFLALLFVLLLIVGFFLISRSSSLDGETGVKSANATEFARLAENENSFLLDVHIPEQNHIPGTDAFIPYNEISENLDHLPEDKGAEILVYCRSGSMSKQAALELQELGYTNVVDLEGGINEYRESNAEVVITPSTFDFGTVVYGDIPTTEFVLTNFTPAPLNIEQVSTSCGCTTADLEAIKLEPYEATTVTVSFNPAIHGDDTDLGQLTRTIYIDTNNPNFPQVTASIVANVVKP